MLVDLHCRSTRSYFVGKYLQLSETRCIEKKNLLAMATNFHVIKDNRKNPSNKSINNVRVLILIKCSRRDKNLF